MKRVGIGGMQLSDVSSGSGQTVENKLMFGTPEWLDAVRHAAAEADRLGLEMSIFSSGGWSETGGPWVPPAEAMKKMVWSETEIAGPQKFSGKLPAPPSNNGLFQNTGGASTDPTFYGDSAVVAFRTPSDEIDLTALKPIVTQNSGVVANGSLLYDGDFTHRRRDSRHCARRRGADSSPGPGGPGRAWSRRSAGAGLGAI